MDWAEVGRSESSMNKPKTIKSASKKESVVPTRLTRSAIVKMVTAALKKYTYPDLGAELFVQDDGWWYVPVHTTKELPRQFPFFDVLAMAEEELQSGNRKIQLTTF
jgi:hypothetical protein